MSKINKTITLLVRSFDLRFYALPVHVEVFHALYSSICANPKLLADHSDESFVVAHKNYAASELGDGFPKRFDCLDVQMIRRLIKNEEVWQS